ncbi:MAG: bifunctional diaminohydroxyphosphoribosylaminopyrimidine deaminase/5-amino-6-(5-phosphoribosylamino)uracil reductase RibD [Flavisolibacter sp.]|jgi:diaminohydroxyphosphoribosylaminopyrimidine deaminase/5-amino-6-(5-phosphoribosylamino)uracil reductase|nr:bifunctional diaminohydroxyphosphoribosylaminopyrimidine deaminase/5-amino-6-(5-phosphoribosylamino)uracil reductase RibD [Flavisolibacter sp.]
MNLSQHQKYMQRCLDLARLGAGRVAPNPLVGAVLVFQDRMIGEGYHQQYGGAHAEVHCIQSVSNEDRQLISSSTLYVSLEPCAHYGKTPPCADLLIHHKIPAVVVGCRDPFSEVNGKGIEKLLASGVKVYCGIMEEACRELNKTFFCYHTLHRPFIVLKWAETADGFLANLDQKEAQRLMISNELSNRMVHQLRCNSMGIIVGRKTALLDDPRLNTRLWPGKDPVRMVFDPSLQLPAGLQIFNGETSTIVFNYDKHSMENVREDVHVNKVHYYQLGRNAEPVCQLVNGMYQAGLQSVLVEGGARLLQSFIDAGLWDEAMVIRNSNLYIQNGLPAPILQDHVYTRQQQYQKDIIQFYKRK